MTNFAALQRYSHSVSEHSEGAPRDFSNKFESHSQFETNYIMHHSRNAFIDQNHDAILAKQHAIKSDASPDNHYKGVIQSSDPVGWSLHKNGTLTTTNTAFFFLGTKMEYGEKLLDTQLSARDIVSEFSGELQGLWYGDAFNHHDDVAEVVHSLLRSRHPGLTLLDEIKWAVSQPGFDKLYKEFSIDTMGRPDTWREFRDFILAL